MTFLKVLLVILAVLWLISLIRIGGRVRYGQAGLFVTALAGPFKIQLLPAKERPKKEKKPKKETKPKKEKKPEEEKPKPEGQPGTLSRLMKLLPVVGQACGALKRKIRIDDLELELVWGGSDAAAIALGYGQANAALGMIWPLFANNFKIKRHSFQIGMDYGAAQPMVEIQAAVTMTVGQIVTLGVHYGVKALAVWTKSGKSTRKKAVEKPKKQEAMSHE
ncbi:MAG: DUF2953 domain-containing protein [Clostridiales bacterium]|nr:DUF2953 domain-containing protein [Clostridiales bacterium]